MLNFSICRKCEHGTVINHELGEDEEIVANPMVECEKAEPGNGRLFMNDKPPSECPFHLEHRMSMQDADESVINNLSGS